MDLKREVLLQILQIIKKQEKYIFEQLYANAIEISGNKTHS